MDFYRFISLLCVILFNNILFIQSFPKIIEFNVGAIFTSNQEQQKIAFNRGIDEANRILESSPSREFKYRLKPLIMSLDTINSFLVSQKTCNLLKNKVIAVIGPTDSVDADQVHSICFQFGIPFIDMSTLGVQRASNGLLTISLYPHFKTIAKLLKDYINEMSWGNLVIIYTDKKDLVKYSELLNKFGNQIYMKKIEFDGSEKYLLKYLQNKHHNHFIVDIPYWHFSTFMKLAEYYNMTTQFYSYLFVNWDTQMLNLANFSHNTAVNITTFSLFPMQLQKTNDKNMQKFQKDIWELEKLKHNAEIFTILTTETAIIHESIRMLAYAINDLSNRSRIHLSSKMSCSSKDGWTTGINLFNAFSNVNMKSSIVSGGQLAINSNPQITISRLKTNTFFQQYGYWTQKNGITTTEATMSKNEVNEEISHQNFRIVTIIDPPFVLSLRKDANGITPSDPSAWSGFCIDLLKEIQKHLKFNYTIQQVEDRNYGSLVKEEDREYWNGLVGAILYRKADIAVSSLTITYDRERVIDFTTPFMNLGISILYQTPKMKPIRLWAFLEPLSTTVWGYVIVSYISVSFVLFVIGRLSPYEWYNPSPCQTNLEYNSNQFNILNSMWFTIGSFMQQGTDIIPKATSTRIVAGVWWFFTLIIISSYTANLAAFLTLARLNVPIENAEDLSKQIAIKYGTVKGGSTFAFFAKSKFPVYKKMYKTMQYNPHLLVDSNEEGIKRINEKYAFILESTTNEFYVRRNCRLVRIGGLLDSKGYGIALAQGSRYRDAFSEAILMLEKKQTIERLRRFYWRKYNNTEECPPKKDTARTSSLGIKETGGVFVMLFTGALSSIIMTGFEIFYKSFKITKTKNTSLCSEMATMSGQNIKKICQFEDEEENEEDGDSSNNGAQSISSSPKIFPTAMMGNATNVDNKYSGNNMVPSGISGPGCAALLDERDYFGSGPILPSSQQIAPSKSNTMPPPQQTITPGPRPPITGITPIGSGILSQTTSFDYAAELGGSSAMTLDSEGPGGIISMDKEFIRSNSQLHHLPPAISPAAKMIQSPIPLGSGGGPGIAYAGPGSQYTISPPASIIGHPIGGNAINHHGSGYQPVFKDIHHPHHLHHHRQMDGVESPPSYDNVLTHPSNFGEPQSIQDQQQSSQVRVKKVAC